MIEKSKSFEDLVMRQKTHEFVPLTYNATKLFPDDKKNGLTSQYIRATLSIAEEYKKKKQKDKIRFFKIAQESLEECRYYILSRDLDYISNYQELKNAIEERSKLLSSYSYKIDITS